jgi:hypothetical protein
MSPFVRPDFEVPTGLETPEFTLVPLRLEHTAADLDAWSSSVEHIHATPGFEGHPWPDDPMTFERNEEDLAGHVHDWERREGFTYSVLAAGTDDVIGCLYIYPARDARSDASVRSWVRASVADLDAALYTTVMEWLRTAWPFKNPEYAVRQ